jgi:hypothetical protein
MNRSNARGERRGPAVNILLTTLEGKDEMINASINLQDLRRKICLKAKAEKSWRFLRYARKRKGFGWNRWSRAWLFIKLESAAI